MRILNFFQHFAKRAYPYLGEQFQFQVTLLYKDTFGSSRQQSFMAGSLLRPSPTYQINTIMPLTTINVWLHTFAALGPGVHPNCKSALPDEKSSCLLIKIHYLNYVLFNDTSICPSLVFILIRFNTSATLFSSDHLPLFTKPQMMTTMVSGSISAKGRHI